MSHQAQRRLATSVIFLVLGLQLCATVLQSADALWPFTNYPMYSDAHHEGKRISARHYIHAITEDGREAELSPADLGVNIWLYEKWAQQLLRARQTLESSSAQVKAPPSPKPIIGWVQGTPLYNALRDLRHWLLDRKRKEQLDFTPQFVALAEKKLGAPIQRLRIEDTAYVVTRNGMAETTPFVLWLDIGSQGAVARVGTSQ